MFWKKWGEARRRRERAALRAEIMADVGRMLSFDRVTSKGQVNPYPASLAVRNVPIANLNLKFYGYELARAIADGLPPRADTREAFVGLRSKGSTQADMESEWLAHWCGRLLVPVIMHRKLWELAYVLQAIYENGHMREGARGLGFGCGTEPLPSYLASRGVQITVTDLDAERAQAAGWADTGQHAASLEKAFQPGMVDRATFDRLVDLEIVDMNAIPDDLRDYDFCWSICALEHLGSIAQGLAFIENSLATLRPGGLAVHTTEFNIDPRGPTIDNWPSVLFQRHHLTGLAERLRAQGHEVAEFDFDLGDKPMDRFIDLPPYAHDLSPELREWHGTEQHLKVATDGFVATCFGIIVRKAG